jgi:hypothetical protein
MKRSWIHDTHAIILPAIIAITFIFLSSIIWLIGALIVNRTFDSLLPYIMQCDPRVLAISQSALNAYAVVIVIVDVGLLVWWGLSAQKKESVESPGGYYGG